MQVRLAPGRRPPFAPERPRVQDACMNMQAGARGAADRGRRYGWILALGFVALAVVASGVALLRIRHYLIEQTLSRLHSINNWAVRSLDRQFARMIEQAGVVARDAEHQALLLQTLSGRAGREARFALRRHLAEDVFPLGYRDMLLLDAHGRIALAMRRALEGEMPPEGVRPFVREALRGEALVSHPFVRDGRMRIWLLQPVRDGRGTVVGALALERTAHDYFGETAALARFGTSAGTYLVDREGRLLTASRFESQLRRAGVLAPGQSSILNLVVRDPGRNLLEEGRGGAKGAHPSAWPPTFAVAHLLPVPGRPAIHESPEPYRDYRGVPVFGAWQWDEAHRLGVITEIDADEALAAWRYARDTVLAMLVLLVVAGLAGARHYGRMRRRLAAESARLRDLLMNATAEGIYGVDTEGRCIFINAAGVAMLGYDSAAELLGRNMHEAMHHTRPDGSPYPEQACRIFRSFRERTRVHCRDEVFWRKDGTSFPVEYRARPVFDENGAMIGGVVTFLDISELLAAEREREKMERQVQHAQRLESLGVLAGGIAHDFNNILAAIMGNAALARMRVTEAPLEARERLDRIEASCEQAATLCRQMLAYSGKGRFVVRPVNLSRLVEEITHLLEVSLGKSVVVKYQLAENLPPVEADEAQIQQVIMNLVTNANEAIGARSGVISTSTGVMHADEDYLRDCHGDAPQPGRYAWLEVSDTGCGMDRETMERIFDPFFTTKSTGRGLGMSAVLGIVRGHKGALKVYSEPGRGTTFKLLLPAMEQEEARDGAEAAARADDWRGRGTVLVVDDEETVRETTALMLEELGFSTIMARDGRDALEIFRRRHGEIDVVLMDLTMPGMSGEECFREMRRVDAGVRVVLTSGYNEQDAIQHFTGKGLAGFVQKPATMDKLRAAMRAALEDGDA